MVADGFGGDGFGDLAVGAAGKSLNSGTQVGQVTVAYSIPSLARIPIVHR